jgi:hypothetical protein
MKYSLTPHTDNQGFVLVTALWILVILSLIGIMTMETSTIELQIAANEKFHKMSFYDADAGPPVAAKIISQTIDSIPPGNPNTANITIYGTSAVGDATAAPAEAVGAVEFYQEIYGFISDERVPLATDPALERDLSFTITDRVISVDIVNAGAEHMDGNPAIFPPPPGAPTGIIVWFDINSFGTGPTNAQTLITAGYGKVPGAAGGL